MSPPLDTADLGLMPYAAAFERQRTELELVLASRDTDQPLLGRLLTVEHPAVITVSNRPAAGANLLATPEMLAKAGVAVERTDRGGDITYHGPGQLVLYPILDLNRLALGLHEYMRLLEQVVIDTLAHFGVHGERDTSATGVWVKDRSPTPAKIAAMGVRVRRWVSMHGLALNVNTNLDHFNFIVPCGLAGRGVTSLERELGPRCPSMNDVKRELTNRLTARLQEAAHFALEHTHQPGVQP